MRQLKEHVVYDEAVADYRAEVRYFQGLGQKPSTLAKKMSKEGLNFLAYFSRYIVLKSFWLSWSKAGVLQAADQLGLPVNKVARTTNHVESFNGRIKGKFFSAYNSQSGRLPRIDVWVLTLVTKALPAFFQSLKDKSTLNDYYISLRCVARNGHLLPISSNTLGLNDIDDEKVLDDLLSDSDESDSIEDKTQSDDTAILPLELDSDSEEEVH
jgi:hypothetical protein